MPSANWWGGGLDIDRDAVRAQRAERRINDKPVTVTLRRAGTPLDPQTVRVEGSGARRSGTLDTTNASPTVGTVTVVGVRGHPTLDDFDVQVGDRFGLEGSIYTVLSVTHHAGETQALCQRVQS
jgi:hypothetical protein